MLLRYARVRVFAWTALVLMIAATRVAFASSAPPGRAWAPVVPVAAPGVTGFSTVNLMFDEVAGRPAMVVSAKRTIDPTNRWGVMAWADSAWQDSIWTSWSTGGMPRVGPLQGDTNVLSYSSPTDLNGYSRLVLWNLGQTSAEPETIATTTTQGSSFAYAAAASPARRWVVRTEQHPNEDWTLHAYMSEQVGTWQPVGVWQVGSLNCAIAALEDKKIVLVQYGTGGATWAVLDDQTWSPLQPFPHVATGLTFTPRPGGGWWLVSAASDAPRVDAWTGNDWTTEATLQAVRDPGHGFIYVGWIEPSVETTRKPAIAWQEAWSVGPRWFTAAHVSWPVEVGWSPGYQVPQSDSMYIGPSVALDQNEDTWVAWSVRYGGLVWTHSYVKATASAPEFVRDGPALRVEWTLSESAPQSWWAVLRDPGTGVFDPVTRVRAKDEMKLAWTDPAPPDPGASALRYRIRRESADARYVVLGPEATVSPLVGVEPLPPPRVALALRAYGNPVGANAALELSGAAPGAELEITLRDVRGRAVSTTRVRVGPDGTGVARLEWGSNGAGVYFAFARDAQGRTSPAIKLVRVAD